MITILIFAGQSKRFWPLGEKSFFPLCGTTLIETQVKRLKQAGCTDLLLVSGVHNRTLAKRTLPGLKIIEQKDLTLGMRGALLSALPRCGKKTVMVVSGNDVIESDAYQALRTKAKDLTGGGLILARKVKQYFPGGYLSVRGKRITGIVEKPAPGSEPSKLVNIVAHVHADASVLLTALKAVRPSKDDGYEVALDSLFQTHHYEAVRYAGIWQPVKYPWHLLSLLGHFLPDSGSKPVIDRSAVIHPTAVVEGAVMIGKGVTVMGHATVAGPCTIGDGTIIANNALVRGSSVGRNCVIGYNTEVARSILGNNVWTHSSYLGDSILGSDISLGAGTTTGNLRLDEAEISSKIGGQLSSTHLTKLGLMMGDACRTGIHTCTAPGIKIGQGSFINSCTLVAEDVPDHSFVKEEGRGKITIKPNQSLPHKMGSRDRFRAALKHSK